MPKLNSEIACTLSSTRVWMLYNSRPVRRGGSMGLVEPPFSLANEM